MTARELVALLQSIGGDAQVDLEIVTGTGVVRASCMSTQLVTVSTAETLRNARVHYVVRLVGAAHA